MPFIECAAPPVSNSGSASPFEAPAFTMIAVLVANLSLMPTLQLLFQRRKYLQSFFITLHLFGALFLDLLHMVHCGKVFLLLEEFEKLSLTGFAQAVISLTVQIFTPKRATFFNYAFFMVTFIVEEMQPPINRAYTVWLILFAVSVVVATHFYDIRTGDKVIGGNAKRKEGVPAVPIQGRQEGHEIVQASVKSIALFLIGAYYFVREEGDGDGNASVHLPSLAGKLFINIA